MKITRITVWHLDLPLSEPYWLSGGRLKFEQLDSTFIRIDTDEGVSGWGEGCPWGHTYLPAHGPGIRAGIETLAPALIGSGSTQSGPCEPGDGCAAAGSSLCQIADRHGLLGYPWQSGGPAALAVAGGRGRDTSGGEFVDLHRHARANAGADRSSSRQGLHRAFGQGGRHRYRAGYRADRGDFRRAAQRSQSHLRCKPRLDTLNRD